MTALVPYVFAAFLALLALYTAWHWRRDILAGLAWIVDQTIGRVLVWLSRDPDEPGEGGW